MPRSLPHASDVKVAAAIDHLYTHIPKHAQTAQHARHTHVMARHHGITRTSALRQPGSTRLRYAGEICGDAGSELRKGKRECSGTSGRFGWSPVHQTIL